jgi:protein associated with RNAse G/E
VFCEHLVVQWASGDVIVHQEVWRDRLWAARPLVVAEDTPERLLLWLPKGTVRKVPMTPPHRVDPGDRIIRVVELLDRCDWIHVDHAWDVSSLWLLRPGDWHAVWISWLPSGKQFGWYVNLQRPFRRTPIGIESMDLMLDVVVEPDRSWRWKDEDEFDQLLERGIFDPPLGGRVRDEAASVIRRLEADEPPFSEPWPSWQPDPSWPMPELVAGWENPRL